MKYDRDSENIVENYYYECLHIIKDMFGVNTEKYNKAKERLDKAKTFSQISNTMSWVRVNLL